MIRLRRSLAALLLFVLLVLPTVARAQDPARATDIVLGFFNKTLPDGTTHNLVDELERAKGGLEYFEWHQMGFPEVHGGWDQRRVWTAMELMVETGHRIRFNLTGFKFSGDRNPLRIARDVTAEDVGYTSWELTQIRTHRAFWDATDFFLRQEDGSYREATANDLGKLGLRYQGPDLPALGDLKGKLLRSSPEGDVYAVRGRPGQELFVPRAPAGEDDAARARRAEDLVEGKAALDALASQGVRVVRRHEVGTFKGELAYVRDAVSPDPALTTTVEGKTLSLARDASGELAVAGISSPHVRVDAEVPELASAAKTALTSEALSQAALAGDRKLGKYLTADAPVVDASQPRGVRRFLADLVDYVGRDLARGAGIARAVAEKRLALVTEGDPGAGEVKVALDSGLPFGTLATLLVRDATAVLDGGDVASALKAECLAAAVGFAKRMGLPFDLVNDRLGLDSQKPVVDAILAKSGANRLSGAARESATATVTARLSEQAPAGEVDAATRAALRSRDAAVQQAPRTGISQALDERARDGADRGGER